MSRDFSRLHSHYDDLHWLFCTNIDYGCIFISEQCQGLWLHSWNQTRALTFTVPRWPWNGGTSILGNNKATSHRMTHCWPLEMRHSQPALFSIQIAVTRPLQREAQTREHRTHFGLDGVCVCAGLKLRYRKGVSQQDSISACSPPNPYTSIALHPPTSPFVWSLPPLQISHSSPYVSMHCWQSWWTDTKSAGRQWQHPDKITVNSMQQLFPFPRRCFVVETQNLLLPSHLHLLCNL